MKLTVAQVITNLLESEGVEIAFGISGSHYISFFNALKDSKIKYISVKHESAASLMALNYVKIAQKPCLILGTAGPGALNLIAGIAEIYKANIPCFIITPIVPTYLWGKNSFQEDTGMGNTYSISDVMKIVTKKSILPGNPENIPNDVKTLCKNSLSGRKGPVHLLVPTDFFEQKIEFLPQIHEQPVKMILDIGKIRNIAVTLSEAKKPIFLIGQRSWFPNLSTEIAGLSNEFGIPIVVTGSAKGVVDEYSPYFAGVLDLYGHRSAEVFIKNSDLVLSIGEDFGEFATLKYDPDLFKNKKIVQIDIDENDIARNYPAFASLCGEMGDILIELGIQMRGMKIQKYFADTISDMISKENATSLNEQIVSTMPLKPQRVLKEISGLLPENAQVFGDIGANGYFSLRNLKVHSNSYSISMCNCTMGQGIAGCLGGQLASPKKVTFAICGDGAFLMHGMEIATAQQYNIPIIWIIFVENKYNVVEWAQKLIYGNLGFCTSIFMPDLEKLSDSFGIQYFKVIDIPTLHSGFAEALDIYKREKRSSIIEIAYDKDELLPLKPRTVKFIQDIKNLEDFKTTPALMSALKKVFQEKV
jgi:acetolactate synthase-1/2/3 large subunit